MQPVSQESGQPSSSPGNDWPLKRLRYLIAFNPTKAEVSSAPQDREVSFVPMESIGEHGGLDLDIAKPLADVMNGYTYFRDGDVLVAKITPCFENYKGALAADLTNGLGFGTTELHVLRPGAELTGRYLFYLTMSHRFRELGESYMYGAGGQKRVPEAFIEDLVHPIPPLPEQRAIANFLDRKTAEIDALLEEKQRLLELLEEKRTALITQAVTKGLDPDVEMKDSGLEWLGEIPARWGVTRLKFLTSHIVDCLHSTPRYTEDGDYQAIRTADIGIGSIDLAGARRVDENTYRERIQRLRPRPGDILYSREGERYGFAAMVPDRSQLCLAQRMMHFRASRGIDPEFLMWALNAESTYRQAQQDTTGATSPHVNVETIRNFGLALPELQEQRRIAAFLRRMAMELDALEARCKEAMTLLHEYRTALISAAVTGKIDVREEAA